MNSRWNSVLGRKCSVSYYPILVFTVLTCYVSCLDLEELRFETLDKFKGGGWSGANQAVSYNRPKQFNEFLAPLDTGVDTSVWVESENSSSLEYRTYTFSGLGSDYYCGVTQAKISVKYFLENAAAYTYPCIHPDHGGNSYCYLKNLEPGKNQPDWLEEEFEIDFDKDTEIQLKISLLPDGYIVFDKIIILHDGTVAPPEGCITTTTGADTTTTTDDTTVDPTTDATTETHDSEGTDNTWDPLPSTTPSTTTTTQSTTTTTTLPPITDDVTEEEDSEEVTTTTEISSSTDETSDSTPTNTSDGPSTDTSNPTSTDSSDRPPTDNPDPTSTDSSTDTTDDPFPTTPTEDDSSTPSGSSSTTTRRTLSTTPSSDDDDGGLTLTQILLYIVLPVAILLLLLLTLACYCGIRSHRLKQGRRFKNLEESRSHSEASTKTSNNPEIRVLNIEDSTPNPNSHSWFRHLTGYNPPIPQSSFAPEPNTAGNQYYYSMPYPASSGASHSNGFVPLPPNSQGAVLLNIPDPMYQQSPRVNRSRSNRSSLSSSSRYPMYTGDYTDGTNLPRMRRNY